jgi:hypothetical protein
VSKIPAHFPIDRVLGAGSEVSNHYRDSFLSFCCETFLD